MIDELRVLGSRQRASGLELKVWRTLKPYIVAVVTVALMALVRFMLDSLLGEHHPFVLFLAAVFITSWYGGWRAGMLSLFLGLTVADLLFVHPRGSIGGEAIEQKVGFVIYGIVGLMIVALVEALRGTTQRSELAQVALQMAKSELELRVHERTIELTKANLKLQNELIARQQAEEKVRRLAALVACSEDAIIGVALDGTITDWNIGAEHMFAYSTSDIVGQKTIVLLPPDDHENGLSKLDRLRKGNTVPPYEAVRLRKDGKGVAVSVRLSPVKEDGETVGFSLIYRDLTQARKLEDQLRQSQKMEAVGQLAGGIAHDFNNLLTIISGYSDMLLGDPDQNDHSRSLLEEIQQAGERAAALTRQLLVFSRKDVHEPRIVDLNDTVRGAEKMLRRLIGEDIRLTATLVSNLRHVKVDPGQVEQVIMNLAVNARDAMPTGGKITIETANVDLDESYADSHPELWAGRYVLLAVSDNGSGMDEATRARVFEPFFTTKGVGKGTGLGLAVVHGIVKASGGHVAIYSELGSGTTFKIYLPAVEGIRTGGKSHPGLVAVPKGKETVLLVEDDEGVRRLIGQTLRAAGYTILEANYGGEAVRLAESFEGAIHLLVSDVVMPEMGGRVLAERLNTIRPGIKVMFVSGYTDDAVIRHGVLAADMAFLQKPFTPGVLVRKVREVLDR